MEESKLLCMENKYSEGEERIMYYVLTEEEFKEYRLCRAEIIDL